MSDPDYNNPQGVNRVVGQTSGLGQLQQLQPYLRRVSSGGATILSTVYMKLMEYSDEHCGF